MSENHVIKAHFRAGYHTEATRRVYQYDYGQVLAFSGIDLPESFEAHFSNSDRGGTTYTVIGSDSQAAIPDALLTSGEPVYCYVYLHDTEADGQTVYKVTIPVSRRPAPSDVTPAPVEQSVIDQTIAAANSAAQTADAKASSAARSADSAAESATSAAESMEAAVTAAGTAEEYASDASDSADAARQAAESIDEEYVGGLVDDYLDGHPITETDPTVPAWAKAATKPTYTAAEVGALPDTTQIPDALSDLSDDTTHRTVTDAEKAAWNAKLDAETDPTVPAWAKQPEKPTYTAAEVHALPDTTEIPDDTADLTNGAGYLDAAGVETLVATTPIIPVSVKNAQAGWDDEKMLVISCYKATSADVGATGTGMIFGVSVGGDYSAPYAVDIPDRSAVQSMIDTTIAALDATNTSY